MLESFVNDNSDLISFKRPEGTYLAWLNFKKLNLSDRELKEFLVHKAKLGLGSGISFGKNGSGYARMNCAVPHKTMKQALSQLQYALEEYK